MADLSRYKEVKAVVADTQNAGMEQINALLAEGWELVDAKIVQWTQYDAARAPGYSQSSQWHFILGRARNEQVKPYAASVRSSK